MLRHIARIAAWTATFALFAQLAACTTAPKIDRTAFQAAKPTSILVLPPLNDAPDVNATPSVLSHATYPLAEAGYYVMPVTLVAETFRQNGMSVPSDIHEVPYTKLREIFGADAALYIKVNRYGTSYMIISSAAVVQVQAQLIDLKNGQELWKGQASASSEEGGNSGGGLAGMLITALLKQVINSTTDASHGVAGIATSRLLAAGHPNGVLYGPRSPLYGKD
ncbi:hypothetical protein HNP33_002445 [Comamonas odontotermitis]|uniref:Lipoprotein n=1 Tax=Comamonas odontotermitis TaxID=379895 RepID=A0ABR6RGS4_9BURK|nr:hypothetical protein [Comamonas odontotermitis]